MTCAKCPGNSTSCENHWEVELTRIWSQDEVLAALRDVLANPHCRTIVFSERLRSVKDELRRVDVRPIQLKAGLRWQATLQTGKQTHHRNFATEELLAQAKTWLQTRFISIAWETTSLRMTCRFSKTNTYKVNEVAIHASLPDSKHNRTKAYLIPEGEPCPFLQAIGVMTSEGQVRAQKQHKFRQINRFLELVRDISDYLPSNRSPRIIDFGSGKSYLTFALHHWLTHLRKTPAEIVGVDHNPAVIADCQRIATELHCEGLRFEVAKIAQLSAVGPVDMVVSLHACDTATDDALLQALRWEAPVILAVPCCQHEFAHNMQPRDPWRPLAEHGILRERWAALTTDAYRACVLELCGYDTQVLEFIDLEHTPKNLLLRAVRRTSNSLPSEEKIRRYHEFKAGLGLETTYLEQQLGDFFPSRITTPHAG